MSKRTSLALWIYFLIQAVILSVFNIVAGNIGEYLLSYILNTQAFMSILFFVVFLLIFLRERKEDY